MNILKNKKFRYGGLSVLFTVIFVVAVILLNVIFNLLLSRFDFTADLSDNNMYSIDKSTSDYLATVDGNIQIIVAADEETFTGNSTYFKQTSEIIKRFTESNPGISVSYIDLNANPQVYAEYGSTLAEGDVVVKSEKTGRYQIVTSSDYLNVKYYFNGDEVSYEEAYTYYSYGYSSYVSTDVSAAAETAFLSAIMNVTDENPVRVAFSTGYGEGTNATLTNLLETNVYSTETLDLTMTKEIDADIDYLVLYAPLYDYSNDTLTLIDKWLDNGGKYGKNLMYIPSSEAPETPNLDAMLKDWGIEMGKGYLLQTDANYAYSGGSSYQFVSPVEDTDYIGGIDTSTKSTFGDQLRPITLLFTEKGNYTTQAILTTFDGAVIKPFTSGDAWKTSDATEIGAYNVLVESNKTVFIDNSPVYSRVFVFGSDVLLNETFLSAAQANNAEIAMSLFNTTSGKETTEITLTPKSFTMTSFEISGAAASTIAVVFAIAVPLVIIVAGIVVWVRRRRR